MSNTTTQNDMLTEDAASAYLGGIPPRTLRQWRHLGKGPPYVKVGHHVRYSRRDLDAYLAAHRVDPQPARG